MFYALPPFPYTSLYYVGNNVQGLGTIGTIVRRLYKDKNLIENLLLFFQISSRSYLIFSSFFICDGFCLDRNRIKQEIKVRSVKGWVFSQIIHYFATISSFIIVNPFRPFTTMVFNSFLNNFDNKLNFTELRCCVLFFFNLDHSLNLNEK